ncbi:HIT-like protein [Glarea lozoyensis ATCC 20868]|uniref:HIT-like protein n=1 Tax=Glarea lozoyensis (strain ATCC 20868 / MF5171) TaxID=1116229 RepID=S3CFI3_GLAL2|nr:HIT-like protein [Glarea lozoyensis ATCC 20868]EPE25247.1 HIT-like protein [Glarea lozoyensis ATCC 20868]
MPSSSTSSCPFCTISQAHPPSSTPSHNHELTDPPSFVVLSTPLVLAFLDILPLAPGHLLVTTRQHHEKISDVSEEEAVELGRWLPRLSRVSARVGEVWDWNIVQNNGAAAAQVVPHVHFHLIPRPGLTPELRNRSFTMFGRGQRTELDDEEAVVLARKLRDELRKEIARLEGGKL